MRTKVFIVLNMIPCSNILIFNRSRVKLNTQSLFMTNVTHPKHNYQLIRSLMKTCQQTSGSSSNDRGQTIFFSPKWLFQFSCIACQDYACQFVDIREHRFCSVAQENCLSWLWCFVYERTISFLGCYWEQISEIQQEFRPKNMLKVTLMRLGQSGPDSFDCFYTRYSFK